MTADILPFKKPEKKPERPKLSYHDALLKQLEDRGLDKALAEPVDDGKSVASAGSKKTSGQFYQAAKTNNDIYKEVLGDVVAVWQVEAVHNRLNDHVRDRVAEAQQNLIVPSGSVLIADLNVLSRIERSLGMKTVIFTPGCVKQSSFGWMVSFHRESEIFSTPPDMADESMARALAIVLFIEFEKRLKSLGRSIVSNDI